MKVLKTIGTHDGTFHCDEILGCAMLRQLFPEAAIVRSRKDEVLKKCDIVIDVGGKYEPENYLFDHHQKGFEHSMSTVLPGKKSTIKLSSAGLVYCHFGKDILKAISPDISNDELDIIFDKVYEGFVQEIDAIDNGIPICDSTLERYTIHTSLSSRVKKFNRTWTTPASEFNETQAFNDALALVSSEFIEKVKFLASDWIPAKMVVKSAVEKRYDVHSSGEIIVLETFCPWKAHLFTIEENLDLKPGIKFVLFQDRDTWRVQAVSLNEASYELRIPLHSAWRGLRDDEVSNVAGIDGCVFVHASGFIGGNKTKEGALQMAIKTLELNR